MNRYHYVTTSLRAFVDMTKLEAISKPDGYLADDAELRQLKEIIAKGYRLAFCFPDDNAAVFEKIIAGPSPAAKTAMLGIFTEGAKS